jgi:hypothetical protein
MRDRGGTRRSESLTLKNVTHWDGICSVEYSKPSGTKKIERLRAEQPYTEIQYQTAGIIDHVRWRRLIRP